MSAPDLMKEWKKRNPQIENILLFVSDALRWDYTPKSVSSLGVTFKTVASGIITAASFPSIVTGLYPPHHGVYSFIRDRLSNGISSLLNLYGYNTSLWTENTWIGQDPLTCPLYRFLRHKNKVSLKKIEPPFIYLEDEKGGHCPYGWSPTDKEYEEWDCLRFFRDFGRSEERVLRKKYQEGIQRSVREFKNRMKIIEEKGLADETLVVFLSDHGELLGEYGGLVGHGILTAPEAVYVPTVFIHPDLPNGESFEKEGVLRHVDLYPTICDLLGSKVKTKVDGVSLFDVKKLPDLGSTFSLEKMEGRFRINSYNLREVSVWDKDGGYLFREDANLIFLLLRAFYLTVLCNSSGNAIYLRQRLRRSPNPLKNYSEILKNLCRTSIKYGSPFFGPEDARVHIKEIYKTTIEPAEKEKERIKRIVRKLKNKGKI